MFGTDQVVSALCVLRIPELAAFSLPHRIPRDDDITTLHQPLAKCLIVVLSIGGVAAWHKDPRVFFNSVVWRVHQGCDIDPWQAFENELLDMKAVHLNLACDPRIQRSFLFRQTTQHGEEVLSYLALHASQVLFVCYLLPSLAACLILLPRDVHLVFQVWRNDGCGGSDGGKNLKRFRRRSVGCDGGKYRPNAE